MPVTFPHNHAMAHEVVYECSMAAPKVTGHMAMAFGQTYLQVTIGVAREAAGLIMQCTPNVVYLSINIYYQLDLCKYEIIWTCTHYVNALYGVLNMISKNIHLHRHSMNVIRYYHPDGD